MKMVHSGRNGVVLRKVSDHVVMKELMDVFQLRNIHLSEERMEG